MVLVHVTVSCAVAYNGVGILGVITDPNSYHSSRSNNHVQNVQRRHQYCMHGQRFAYLGAPSNCR